MIDADTTVVIFGVMSVIMSFWLGKEFYKLPNKLAKNIAYMAWGGALAGVFTLIFSFVTLLNAEPIPHVLQVLLRYGIYTAITVADLVMYFEYRKIARSSG